MIENAPQNIHSTVLRKEIADLLDVRDDGIYLDATLGLGGHAEEILERHEAIKLIAIDQDAAALELSRKRLERYEKRIIFVNSNFARILQVLADLNIERVDGIIADLGVSSLQLDSEQRGFSFRFDAPLDMRMNPDAETPTAAELLEELDEEEIANLIYNYGEERSSRRIARRIVEKRESGEPVKTTKQLAELVARSVKRGPKDKIHPATRTFQALRIAVNRELDILEQFLIDGIDSLKTEGRFAVITFHSLEDRIVKQTFQRLAGKCFCPPRMPVCICGAVKKIEIVTRKPLTPSDDETEKNPRSRSAKLRVVRRIADQ
jgi:16S rRNA (cytosine1402-N4)-methyltransferase